MVGHRAADRTYKAPPDDVKPGQDKDQRGRGQTSRGGRWTTWQRVQQERLGNKCEQLGSQ